MISHKNTPCGKFRMGYFYKTCGCDEDMGKKCNAPPCFFVPFEAKRLRLEKEEERSGDEAPR